MNPEDDIPELIDGFEGSLRTPDPDAIRTGLRERTAARKRVMGSAAAFVAVLAIGAGAFALTGTDATETATTDEDTTIDGAQADAASGPSSARSPAVADDSPPRMIATEDGVLALRVISIEDEPIDEITTVSNAPHRLVLHRAPMSDEYATDSLEVIGPCRAEAFAIAFDPVERQTFRIISTVPFAGIVAPQASSLCEALPAEWLFAVGQTLSMREVEGGAFPVYAFDSAGRPAWTLRAEAVQWDDASASSTTATTNPPPTTDGQPAPTSVPETAGPPAFEPSEGVALTGRWELVSLWNDGEPVGLDAFSRRTPTLSIFGRSLAGNDGCNFQGGGLIYATPNGAIRLQSGNSTLAGCPDTLASETYTSALFNGDRWGFTSAGNLVIGHDVALAEFSLVEAAPTGSLVRLSAPLNQLWVGDSIHDYINFTSESATIDLHFEGDVAVVTDEICGEFGSRATFEDGTEGPISFAKFDRGAEPCEPTGDAAIVLDAMVRADYFATTQGGVQLWEGPQPLAIFAHE